VHKHDRLAGAFAGVEECDFDTIMSEAWHGRTFDRGSRIRNQGSGAEGAHPAGDVTHRPPTVYRKAGFQPVRRTPSIRINLSSFALPV
jgi:hypothetical protein